MLRKILNTLHRGRDPRAQLVLIMAILAAALLTPRVSQMPSDSSSQLSPGSIGPNKSKDVLRAKFLSLPLGFETGQSENEFRARSETYDLNLQPSQIVMAAKSGTSATSIRTTLTLLQGNPMARASASEPLQGKSNYLIGNDPGRWRTDVSRFGKVRYSEVYPGIDLVYYGKQQQLEYDFIIAPGRDPRVIRLAFDPGVPVLISGEGELVAQTPFGEVRQPKPIAYQEGAAEREPVAVSYAVNDAHEISFEIGAYDPGRALVIDPTLVYASYLGGSGDDSGSSIALDFYNNIYLTGTTSSANLPTKNPIVSTNSGLSDIFVIKLDPYGALVYSTYIGGAGADRADGLAVTWDGKAYVAGRADPTSSNFPTTAGSHAPTYRGGDFDGVVFALNSGGNGFLYSTFLGGEENDSAVGIALDYTGLAYVTGGTRSTGFPTTSGAYQPTKSGDTDGFLVKFNASGSTLLYATYLGGGGTDRISGVAVDSSFNAYVDGYTSSSDFPTQNAFQSAFGGSFDAFVAKFDTKVSGAGSLVFCSYLGGIADDKAYGLALIAGEASVYLVGQTSSNNFPVLLPAQSSSGGSFDAFITKVGIDGVKYYSTYLGGSGDDRGTGIAVNSWGNAYVTGFTSSPNFPVVGGAAHGGAADAFVTKLTAEGNGINYSTYLGGSGNENLVSTVTATNPIVVDSSENVYLTGYTSSNNFPTVLPLQNASAGGQDAFTAKITDAPPGGTMQFEVSSSSVSEGAGSAVIRVIRTGITAYSGSVQYRTSDGTASNRMDYTNTSGTLYFANGETSKSFRIPLIDDVYVEGNETINLTLSTPSSSAFLGTPVAAVLTIFDNDTVAPIINPLEDAQFFVRQHYLDFLNREPEPDGLAYWTNEISKCGANLACVKDRRIDVSTAFFVSNEFQQSGGFVYRLYLAILGREPSYAEFSADRSKVLGGSDLFANRQAMVIDFMARPEFANKYPDGLNADGLNFIEAMVQTARSATGAPLTNLEGVLTSDFLGCVHVAPFAFCKERVVEDLLNRPDLIQVTYNRAFVVMEYFGYLQRDADPGGRAFWLDVINNREPNNYRGMVCSFITSAEYQQRFSPVVTRTNAECSGVH